MIMYIVYYWDFPVLSHKFIFPTAPDGALAILSDKKGN